MKSHSTRILFLWPQPFCVCLSSNGGRNWFAIHTPRGWVPLRFVPPLTITDSTRVEWWALKINHPTFPPRPTGCWGVCTREWWVHEWVTLPTLNMLAQARSFCLPSQSSMTTKRCNFRRDAVGPRDVDEAFQIWCVDNSLFYGPFLPLLCDFWPFRFHEAVARWMRP